MNANPKLWQLICAVIVLIAVQFAPALARAHADHGLQAHVHGHHHAVTHAAHTPVAHHLTKAAFTRDVLADAAFAKTDGSVPHELLLTAARPAGVAPVDADGCVDGCCGAGMGCCGGAALVAASQCLPPAVHSHRLDITGAVLATGIEPASLRKPPRPLA